MKPHSEKTLKFMMIVVAVSWLLGIIELSTSWIGIPRDWLLLVMLLSVLAHSVQACWFTIRSALPVTSAIPHVLAILVLGMPYIWRYGMRHPGRLNGKIKNP
ncbi:MAG: hypothetical protein P1U57_00680 [Oleibacter sp.]|nr:hypothetical protein [Thalassolituus sp.]